MLMPSLQTTHQINPFHEQLLNLLISLGDAELVHVTSLKPNPNAGRLAHVLGRLGASRGTR